MTTLKLYFSAESLTKFGDFLDWYLYRAGSSWDGDRVTCVLMDSGAEYELTGTADELYRLGYDWALYQFPPVKTSHPVS